MCYPARMSNSTLTVSEMGRMGGLARAKALSPSRRKTIARLAALTRWSKQKPAKIAALDKAKP